jgi:ABC-type multidrug transport system ATPase subunit
MRGVDVSVRLGSVVALPPTTFEIHDGERVCVVGPNGSGKTTLLRVLARLLEPTSGHVFGRPPRGVVVLVHQRPHLFRGSALENVAFAARLDGQGESHALATLDMLGLADVARRSVGALSGGERRRVAVARALARGPTTLLLDEPLAELDPTAQNLVATALAEFRGTVVTTSPAGRSPLASSELRLGDPPPA